MRGSFPMMRLIRAYVSTSLLARILGGFILGAIAGGALWYLSLLWGKPIAQNMVPWLSPFGTVFVNMLKMIVIPVIFASLVVGAASLPVNKFGRVGLKVIAWYFLCSFLAAGVGVAIALAVDPGSGADLGNWKAMAGALSSKAQDVASRAVTSSSFRDLLLNMFQNPFKALAEGNFLPIIVFSILFGLALRVLMEGSDDGVLKERLQALLEMFDAAREVIFKIVDWVLEYSPIGVFFLTLVNFSIYGPKIVGPYVSVLLGVIGGIIIMVLVVYPLLLLVTTRQNPFRIIRHMEEASLMAFVTRSSAATLPVSMKVSTEELGINEEIASFSLPLGATINMDGVCVHLPMFAVLAANIFGINLTAGELVVFVITTVLVSVGVGGVPGGSVMLLFIILQTMGLSNPQVAVIVALALGINPILDMFETMNNVTGDMVCTYAVAKQEGLLHEVEET